MYVSKDGQTRSIGTGPRERKGGWIPRAIYILWRRCKEGLGESRSCCYRCAAEMFPWDGKTKGKEISNGPTAAAAVGDSRNWIHFICFRY